MQKERAASALKHGLPVPTPLPSRARGFDSSRSPSSAPPISSSGLPLESRRMPLAVKLLGLGLAILGSIYGLTLFRDHKASPGPEPTRAALDSEAAVLPTAPAPEVRAPLSPSASAAAVASTSAGAPSATRLK